MEAKEPLFEASFWKKDKLRSLLQMHTRHLEHKMKEVPPLKLLCTGIFTPVSTLFSPLILRVKENTPSVRCPTSQASGAFDVIPAELKAFRDGWTEITVSGQALMS